MGVENKSGVDSETARQRKAREIALYYRPLDSLKDEERPVAFRQYVEGHKQKYGAVDFVTIEEGLRQEGASLHLLAIQLPENIKPGYIIADVNDIDETRITPRTHAITTRLGRPAIEKAALEHGIPYDTKANLERLRDAGFFKKVPELGKRRIYEKKKNL